MKKSDLIKYCEDNNIVVPKNASLEQLNAAIVRASLHEVEIEHNQETCFGYWQHELVVCLTCEHKDKCFRASMGVSKEKYFKQLETLEKPKIRIEKRLAKYKKIKL